MMKMELLETSGIVTPTSTYIYNMQLEQQRVFHFAEFTWKTILAGIIKKHRPATHTHTHITSVIYSHNGRGIEKREIVSKLMLRTELMSINNETTRSFLWSVFSCYD